MLNLERSRNNVVKISQENPSPVYATIDALLIYYTAELKLCAVDYAKESRNRTTGQHFQINESIIRRRVKVWYGIVEFNVPLDTV